MHRVLTGSKLNRQYNWNLQTLNRQHNLNRQADGGPCQQTLGTLEGVQHNCMKQTANGVSYAETDSCPFVNLICAPNWGLTRSKLDWDWKTLMRLLPNWNYCCRFNFDQVKNINGRRSTIWRWHKHRTSSHDMTGSDRATVRFSNRRKYVFAILSIAVACWTSPSHGLTRSDRATISGAYASAKLWNFERWSFWQGQT